MMPKPKDLGVKIVPPIVAKWTRIRDQAKTEIENNETQIEVNQAIVSLAEGHLSAEKQKV